MQLEAHPCITNESDYFWLYFFTIYGDGNTQQSVNQVCGQGSADNSI